MTRLTRRIELPAERASIPRARHFAREALGSTAPDGVVELVELLTSELVTNAVVHGGTPFEVRVVGDGKQVRVEVADGSSARPTIRRDPDPLALSGRGLQFVERLAKRWGIDADPRGKVVWFEVAC